MNRDELKAWLNRAHAKGAQSWRDWYDGEEYLGERTARKAPDPVNAERKCRCVICMGVE